ncbi:MAG TPA: hypothetical protein VMQ86_15685 [Bryobacteraceae bacterium]|jgi:hypothetical protein|nr:hypothetical protein [Bryobacteraceae bacterium]
MNQTLHILRKDIRRFRYELCVTIALTGAFAWSRAAADMPGQPQFSRAAILAGFSGFFLVLAWWFLITQLIHAESLAGDRQFWVTRPYSWRHLLAAKILFVTAFVNVPLLAAQLAILAAAGYQPLAGIPKLLWMQFGVAAFLLVPAFALGTVTRNLAQFVLTILCGLLSLYITLVVVVPSEAIVAPWPNRAVTAWVACAGATLMIIWQFSRRSTMACIGAGLITLLLAGVVYYSLPMPVQNAMRLGVVHEPEPKGVCVYIPPLSNASYSQGSVSDRLVIGLPFAYTGLPKGEIAQPEMMDVTIEGPSGQRWSSGWERNLAIPRGFYRSIQGATVSVHGSLRLSLPQQTIVPLSYGQATRIPGDGFCEVSPGVNQWEIFCRSPFRPPYDVPSGGGMDIDHGSAGIERHSWTRLLSTWDSPFPDFALSPVFTGQATSPIDAEISLVRDYPSAWITRGFAGSVRIPGVR